MCTAQPTFRWYTFINIKNKNDKIFLIKMYKNNTNGTYYN